MCLFCSFRSSFQNSACSFQKQRNCRYSNFPYFSGFLRCNRQKSLKYQAFRQILSRPKPPSKIAKQPLIHKTRNAVDRKVSRVRIPNSPPQKPVNKPVYRLFNFCLKGKARTIFGFQGRKSAVLPGTDRTPAAAEVAALRQGKPCLHRLCRGDLGFVIQVGVDIRRGGKVAVPQPLLNVFEGDAVGQQQAGTTVPLRYNNDKRKKPLFSRGLSVCRHLFNSFSKLKCDEKIIEKRRLFH